MAARKQTAVTDSSTEANDNDISQNLTELQLDLQRRLNKIAAHLQQASCQASADLHRATVEATLGIQLAQQQYQVAHAQAYRDAAVNCQPMYEQPTQLQTLASDLEAACKSGSKAVDDARENCAKTLQNEVEAANKEWDKSCTEFVQTLQSQFAEMEAEKIQPRLLTDIANALLWISQHQRMTPAGALNP